MAGLYAKVKAREEVEGKADAMGPQTGDKDRKGGGLGGPGGQRRESEISRVRQTPCRGQCSTRDGQPRGPVCHSFPVYCLSS